MSLEEVVMQFIRLCNVNKSFNILIDYGMKIFISIFNILHFLKLQKNNNENY